ncbi:MAG: ABC transporter ATP-binding protein [Deltaproteobacteria bacterium]|nr:ABC transporter ATP-binding protein [Deltaproteobacteria bacterium]
MSTADTSTSAAVAFRRLVHLLRLEKSAFYVVVIYAAGIGVASLAAPIGVQMLVGAIAFGGLVQPIVVLALLVLIGLGLAATLRAAQAWVVERIQQRIFVRVAGDLAERLPRVTLKTLEQEHGPELVNRFFDVVTVQKGAAMLLLDGLFVALQVLTGGALLALYHPALIAFAAALLLAIGAILVFLGSNGSATSIDESKAKYALAAWFEEIARHPALFRDGAGASFARERCEALTQAWVDKRKKHFKVTFRQAVAFLVLQAVATAALLGIGGFLVLNGQLTLGQLVAAELILTGVVAGFAKFGKYLETYYDLIAAVDKLGHLVDLPLEDDASAKVNLSPKEQAVELDLVGVEMGSEAAGGRLAPTTLHIGAGEVVAIVGPSGAGKSTLFDLLVGSHLPTRGHIEIDGVPLRDVTLKTVRERVALVREPAIFEGTVLENILVGRNIQIEQVRAALENVGLWDEIASLPAGLGTTLATNGTNLSSGQARRLAIARAIVCSPACVLFDESLDELDPSIRGPLLRAVLGPHRRWTAVVATNDEHVIRECSRVVSLERVDRPSRADRGVS